MKKDVKIGEGETGLCLNSNADDALLKTLYHTRIGRTAVSVSGAVRVAVVR